MMAGVLLSSISSGQAISRIGRYKAFPIAGTALMTIALFLLSTLDVATSALTASGYMLLMGLGLGLVMQVLIMAVQNAVPYEHLGAGTSGATLFRSIGGTVGVALFGGIFAATLQSGLGHMDAAGGLLPSATEPGSLARLPETVRVAYQQTVASALHPVFRTAAAFGFIGFLLTFALKELPLRSGVPAQGFAEAFAMPRDATSLEELERIVDRLALRENRWRVYASLASEAGLALTPQEVWLLARLDDQVPATLPAIAARLRLDPARLQSPVAGLVGKGMAVSDAERLLGVSQQGRAALNRLRQTRKSRIEAMMAAWKPGQHAEVRHLLDRLTHTLVLEPPAAPDPLPDPG